MYATSIIAALFAAAGAEPLRRLNTNYTGVSSMDMASNVVATAGATQLAMWVPPDGVAHEASSITCVDVHTSIGQPCNSIAIDQVAATSGTTCAFGGVAGFADWQRGTDTSGWLKVSPPQALTAVMCTPND